MRSMPIFPFALAAFPVLTLYVTNADRFAPKVIITPLLLSLGATALMAFGVLLALRDHHKAGLLTGLIVFLFWTYGHATQALFGLTGAAIFQGSWFLLFWISLLGLGTWPILRTKRSLKATSRALNFATACLLAIPLIQIAATSLGRQDLPPMAKGPLPPGLSRAAVGPRPNIYYIIPDAYARADVLKDVFNFDNQAFIDALEQRGFRVAPRARANYCQTDLSLSSSLNMEYLDDLMPAGVEDRSNRALLSKLIADSRTFAWLRSLGYRIVSFATGFHNTDLNSADVYLAPESSLNEFDTGLLRTTPLGTIQSLVNPPPVPDWRTDPDLHKRLKTGTRHPRDRFYFDQHRDRLRNTLDRLPDVGDLHGPVFVLAHLVAPHPPFVFGPAGESLTPDTIYCHDEARDLMRHSDMTPASYRRGYVGQLTYINLRLLQVIDALLADSNPEPVIIIQADHGSGFLLNQENIEDTDLQERFGIFTAARFPGGGAPGFAPDISPVNILRLMFRKIFGAEIKRLSNRSFYSTKTRPYQFTEVTDQLIGRPKGPDLLAVHGMGQGSYWAVGSSGSIAYFDGKAWWHHPGVTDRDLHAIWAIGPKQVWVAGATGVAARFDGRSWRTSATGTDQRLTGLWASAANDLWAIGERGTLLHFNGDDWRPVETPGQEALFAVWGSGSSDVHAVGAGGAILHYDGKTWTKKQGPTSEDLHGVTGWGSEAAWAVGVSGIALRWDGVTWTPVETGTETTLLSVCASAIDDVWAVGEGGITLHYNGKEWKQIHGRTVQNLHAIWCNDTNDAMAVGAEQTVISR